MSKKRAKKPHGQLRQSQVVSTFGPGSLVDLPHYSVLIGGLDFWSPHGREEIHETRLVEKLKTLLGLHELRLYAPPRDNEDPAAPPTGITAWQFPEWFITQDVDEHGKDQAIRSRLLVHRKALSKGKYRDENKKPRPVVPVRFVRACRRGHISDIDWYAYVHSGKSVCQTQGKQLWMDELGTSGDLTEIQIRCACGNKRSLYDASQIQIGALGLCDGNRPWLGPYTKEKCAEPSRLLVRTASNSYFAEKLSVISLPDRDEALAKAVSQAWDNLEAVEDVEQLRYERKKAVVKAVLGDFKDEEVFKEIQTRRSLSALGPPKPVKQAEIETLFAAKEEIGRDKPDGDYYARALPSSVWNKAWMAPVERVVLVHRLREVVAQSGFTRFEALTTDVNGELQIGVTRAALARETQWLPAIENRGEGIFIGFRKAAIETWWAKDEVRKRGERLNAGFEAWRHEHQGTKRQFTGLPYIMLHSLSHLLITAISLECGYPASAIRERVYAGSSGYGILLYTGTSDAEGTLGGLVEIGRQIHTHFKNALEIGRLCSNDPVCAQHDPENKHEARFLQGAACHGCLLIAETSCEQHNDFLDRALVISTLEGLGVEFFSSES